MSAKAKGRETPTEQYPDPAEMHHDAIETRPVDFDWTSEQIGDTWEFWEAVECDECGRMAVVSGSGECPKGHEVMSEGPMMSYYYPIDTDCLGDVEEAALKIADLPLCVVQVGGQYGLALTGGGMNLSWEICEAFLLLDHVPPLHFADLPGMAGRGESARDRWIIRGCYEAAHTTGERAVRLADRLGRMVAEVNRAENASDRNLG